jgi:IS5 family transposase
MKSDFRLAGNYLKGIMGDHLNVLLAAAAFNIRKWLRKAALFVSFLFWTQNHENKQYQIAA